MCSPQWTPLWQSIVQLLHACVCVCVRVYSLLTHTSAELPGLPSLRSSICRWEPANLNTKEVNGIMTLQWCHVCKGHFTCLCSVSVLANDTIHAKQKAAGLWLHIYCTDSNVPWKIWWHTFLSFELIGPFLYHLIDSLILFMCSITPHAKQRHTLYCSY